MTPEQIKADIKQRELEKACHQDGCTYNTIGKCRLGLENGCELAAKTAEYAEKRPAELLATAKGAFIDRCKKDKARQQLKKHCGQKGCQYMQTGVCVKGKNICMEGAIAKQVQLLNNPFYVQLKERQEAEALFVQTVLGGEEDGI